MATTPGVGVILRTIRFHPHVRGCTPTPINVTAIPPIPYSMSYGIALEGCQSLFPWQTPTPSETHQFHGWWKKKNKKKRTKRQNLILYEPHFSTKRMSQRAWIFGRKLDSNSISRSGYSGSRLQDYLLVACPVQNCWKQEYITLPRNHNSQSLWSMRQNYKCSVL